MRKIVSNKPNFFINVLCDQKVIEQYHQKYNAVDKIIDDNPEILNEIHKDLKKYGEGKQRICPFSTEQILRMAIVKQLENWGYREVIIRVGESDFLRNFVRVGMGKVMSYGFICGAINRISANTWKTVNNLLDTYAIEKELICVDELRMDSTVCETNIHYPTDNSLLWDSYRVLSRLIRQANDIEPRFNLGYRFHDSKIKKLYTFIATRSSQKSRATKRKVKKSMKTLIERVESLCENTGRYVKNARTINVCSPSVVAIVDDIERVNSLALRVVKQSQRIHLLNEKVPASQRILSIFEEHTELFKRGKSGKPIELGHLVSIAQTREKYICFYDVRDKSLHDTQMKDIALDAHKKKFGELPEKFTADKNYYVSMDDIQHLEEEMSLCAIAKKGRRTEEEIDREHDEAFKAMQRFRAGIEGSISFLKRVFGMSRCVNKGFKHFSSTIASTVFCHNLVILSRSG